MTTPSSEPASVRLLREALEAVMSPVQAAAVLFEGLSAWGDRVPSGPEEVLAAVRGPIRDAIARRLDEQAARVLVMGLTAAVAHAEAPTDVHGPLPDPEAPPAHAWEGEPTVEIEIPVPDSWPDEQTTARFTATSGGPVPVLVLAGGAGFALRLGLALGPEQVAAMRAAELADARAALRTAALVLVDATDPPSAAPRELEQWLERLPADTVLVVWGADVSFGERVVGALEGAGLAHVALSTREGIDPLVDLVRSRR